MHRERLPTRARRRHAPRQRRRLDGAGAGPGQRRQVLEEAIQIQGVGERQPVREQVQLQIGFRGGTDGHIGAQRDGDEGAIQFRQQLVRRGRQAARPRKALGDGRRRVATRRCHPRPGGELANHLGDGLTEGAIEGFEGCRKPNVQGLAGGVPVGQPQAECKAFAHPFLRAIMRLSYTIAAAVRQAAAPARLGKAA